MTQEEHDEHRRARSPWRGGWLGLYVNPEDPRLWVPKKRPGFGWTLNLGHRHAGLAVALLAAFVAAAVAASLLLDS
jgi:uncharacterized membrane protein